MVELGLRAFAFATRTGRKYQPECPPHTGPSASAKLLLPQPVTASVAVA
jgi:hypothetical protein